MQLLCLLLARDRFLPVRLTPSSFLPIHRTTPATNVVSSSVKLSASMSKEAVANPWKL